MLTTGDDCVRSCQDKEDGNYQNCRRCGIFVTCTDGELEEDFCEEGEEWHEADKMCKSGNSGTCELQIVSADADTTGELWPELVEMDISTNQPTIYRNVYENIIQGIPEQHQLTHNYFKPVQ